MYDNNDITASRIRNEGVEENKKLECSNKVDLCDRFTCKMK